MTAWPFVHLPVHIDWYGDGVVHRWLRQSKLILRTSCNFKLETCTMFLRPGVQGGNPFPHWYKEDWLFIYIYIFIYMFYHYYYFSGQLQTCFPGNLINSRLYVFTWWHIHQKIYFSRLYTCPSIFFLTYSNQIAALKKLYFCVFSYRRSLQHPGKNLIPADCVCVCLQNTHTHSVIWSWPLWGHSSWSQISTIYSDCSPTNVMKRS